MKRIFILAIILIFSNINAQNLDEDWRLIDHAFKQKNYSDVIRLSPEFIKTLEINNLKKQLILPYFYLAVSLANTGDLEGAESAFSKAKNLAVREGDITNASKIDDERSRIYWNLSAELKETNPQQALSLLSKIIDITFENNNYSFRAAAMYRESELHFLLGNVDLSILSLEHAMRFFPNIPESQSKLREGIRSRLIELYLGTGQAEKAEELKQFVSEKNQLAITFRLAEELENSGQYMKADSTLQSVQQFVFETSNNKLIEDFVKKRISLYRFSDKLSDGLAELNTIIVQLDTSFNISPDLFFNLSKLYVLANLEEGRIADANKSIVDLNEKIKSKEIPGSLSPNLSALKADVAYLQGEYSDAILLYNSTLENSSTLRRDDLYSVWNNIALSYIKIGDYKSSLTYLNKLEIDSESNGEFNYQVQAALNIGVALIKHGSVVEAIKSFQKAKKLAETKELPKFEILATVKLAEAYKLAGQPTSEFLLEIKRKYESITNPHLKLQVVGTLSQFEKSDGNFESAKSYLIDAFNLSNKLGLINSAIPLAIELGDIELLGGNGSTAYMFYGFAAHYYLNSDQIEEKIPMLLRLSQCYTVESKFDTAKQYLDQSFSNLYSGEKNEFINPNPDKVLDFFYYSLTLTALSYNNYAEGTQKNNLQLIFEAYTQSEIAVEMLTQNFYAQLSSAGKKEDEWLKNINSFHLLISIAADLFSRTNDAKYLETAFNTNEKMRAQTFILDVGQKLVSQINDPLVEELTSLSDIFETDLYASVDIEVDYSEDVGEFGTRGLKITKSEDAEESINVRDKYNDIVGKLKNANSKAVDLVSINTLTLSAVKDFIKPHEVVLNYFTADEALYLFFISKEEQTLTKIDINQKELNQTVESFRQVVQNPKDQSFEIMAKAIYKKLIAPVESKLAAKKILIIPSGKLNNLPFAALKSDTKFLMETNPIVILPNATFLQFADSQVKSSNLQSLLAIGNPSNSFTSALPGAEKEVKEINEIYPESDLLIRSNAKEGILKKTLGNYNIVHFACHGLFNADYPLMSALALAPDNLNDGRLEVHEIYNINMPNTELVVMSACETGLAQIKKNDDMIGLVRGFLYAGVPNVVASLWKVDDIATSRLMTNFYKFLNNGLNKVDALRSAQSELINSAEFNHPFYWSAFIMNGYGI
ncbi:MAG: CHAT domain-containing protein [Melioribacteraceae bacterium]|nr:CHAT domain-containing protein [Melioribacteraceae bacterium]MCF8431210.1 CHAT domain-containing protein [Melioribacteraceae bacterium]